MLLRLHQPTFSTCAPFKRSRNPKRCYKTRRVGSAFSCQSKNTKTTQKWRYRDSWTLLLSYGKEVFVSYSRNHELPCRWAEFCWGIFHSVSGKELRELIDLAHNHDVYVSTGGFMEHLLTHPEVFSVVDRYLHKCKDVGFDVIELSSGFLSFPPEDWLRLVEKVHSYDLKAKP
jgi:hypothetical protein